MPDYPQNIAYAISAQMNRERAAAQLAEVRDVPGEFIVDGTRIALAQVHALLAISHELGAIRELLDR
jgi:hypothetical protein